MAALSAPVLGGGSVELREDIFAVPAASSLLHEAVRAELAARRQGTQATRSRGLVAGGRSKPWRQKGTGRARQGTTRAPHWTGGGVAFALVPRLHTLKVNRKAARKARAMALSQHAQAGSLGVFDATAFGTPRTKDALVLLAGFRSERPCLVVVADGEDSAALSFRNLDRTAVVSASDVEVASLLWARTLLVSRAALEVLGGGAPA